MPYDDGLAHRVLTNLEERGDIEETHMFGGVGYMLDGNLVCGIHGDDLIARVGPDAYQEALEDPHAREMDFTGRPMRGLVFVGAEGAATDAALDAWLDRCLAFVGSLPPKG